jgi:hypothetical protein
MNIVILTVISDKETGPGLKRIKRSSQKFLSSIVPYLIAV